MEHSHMTHSESHDYFRRRELAERAAAKNAATDMARRIHQELAQGYATCFESPLRALICRQRLADDPFERLPGGKAFLDPAVLDFPQ
jgi:hypothetical protein